MQRRDNSDLKAGTVANIWPEKAKSTLLDKVLSFTWTVGWGREVEMKSVKDGQKNGQH